MPQAVRSPNRSSTRPEVAAAIAVAALGLVAAAVAVGAASPYGGRGVLVGVFHALLIAIPVLAGLYALRREADSRFAWMLVAVGFIAAPSLLSASSASWPYSIGRVASWFVPLSIIWLLLAFPSGRLRGTAARWTALAALALVVFLYLPAVLLSTHFPSPSPWSACERGCPANAMAVVNREPGFVGSFVGPAREVAAVLVFLGAAVVLGRRIAVTSSLMKRTLTPVLAGAVLALSAYAAFLILRWVDRYGVGTRILGDVSILALPALALAFVFGLIRMRFVAASAFQELAGEISDADSGSRIRELIAQAISDPSLEIVYWAGTPGRWVNMAGMPVLLPRDDPARAVTEIRSRGRTVAALIHDAALGVEPSVREVASGFALIALENLRLEAELRSSLHELHESRARILTAVDLERERIERDLHDGAQQRLVALRVTLEVAGELMSDDPAAAADMLRGLSADVQATLDEVRSLARGVYPPLLADHGIGEALRMSARASPLSVTVRSRGIGRYSQQIESAVYFCCLEALQNAAKHSGAQNATVTLSEAEELRFEVEDDGSGFEALYGRGGTGLENMRDRIVSLGGHLTVESEPGKGTRVVGSVPVGLAQLTPDVAMLLQRATDALDDCFGIYRAVRDSSGEVVDFAVEHVNDAACRDTGRPRETQIGRTLGYLDADYLASDLFAWERDALERDVPSVLDEVLYERRAGGRRLRKAYEMRAVPMGGGRLALTWREITERKRKEEDLLLQSVALGRSAEGVALVRASDGVILYSNLRFDEIFGYELGELEGRQLSDLNWEAEPQGNDLAAQLDEHGEASFEVRNRRKDGTSIWTEAHVAEFEHPDLGTVWVTMQQDVTSRRRAQETLRMSERRFQMAMRDVPLVLYTMDRDLRYTWVFNNRVGIEGDESAVGRTELALFGPDAERALTKLNRRALAGASVRVELQVDLPTGAATLDITLNPLRGDSGQITGLTGAVYQIGSPVAGGRFTHKSARVPEGGQPSPHTPGSILAGRD